LEELGAKYCVALQERSQRLEYRLNFFTAERKCVDLDGRSRSFALEHNEIEVLTIMPNPEFGSHPKAMGGRREYLGLRRIQRFKVRENRRYLFIK
jgi:hypothetical protein